MCTRGRKDARIICTDRRGYPAAVIIALLDEGDKESIEYYYADGRGEKDEDREEDLMMRDDDYAEKLAEILRSNNIRSVTVLRMEVPCCGGLEMAARRALEQCGRDLPWQVCTVHIDGTVTKN